tara:strand:+ start:937 stop:1359 length:423 start_codon:yes stop_codon:yes gene_type:complete
MAAGEFEYVKPPHLYVEETTSELDLVELETTKMDNTDDLKENETETLVDTEGHEEQAEIEIEIDDDTSTTRIVVKESTKPTRGRAPKLKGVEQEIAEKYRNGSTLKDLGEEYDVSVPCVSNALKRAGETVRSRGRQKKTL